MKFAFLNGQKVRLRAMEPEDVDTLYGLENDPQTWAVTDTSVPYSHDALRQYIDASQNDLFADRQLRLMIVEQDGGTTVGAIDLFGFEPMHARGEVGVAVMERYRGRGYGSEAVRLLCTYAFCHLHMKQLTVHIGTGNAGSLHVFRRLGFRDCGVLRDWWRQDDGYQDVALLQLLREDWAAMPHDEE